MSDGHQVLYVRLPGPLSCCKAPCSGLHQQPIHPNKWCRGSPLGQIAEQPRRLQDEQGTVLSHFNFNLGGGT